MKKDTVEIIETETGYRLISGNAQTVETFDTLEEAQDMLARHFDCWEQAEDEAEYQEISPVSWE
jgi:hypothetical protein